MNVSSYVEHRPAGLERWAECVWERSAGARPDVARVIPDGCMDVVFSEARGLTVVGPNTTAFLAGVPAHSSALGVRMHPGCGPPLFGVEAESLRDGAIQAAELWGDAGRRLEDLVDQAARPGARRALILRWLGTRTPGRAPDPIVRAIVHRLASRAEASLPALGGELGIGERQLRRRVVSQVGYGPKRLARVLRLRRALADARAGIGLAEAAFVAGYADQSHFTHDCTELAGLPPSALVRS